MALTYVGRFLSNVKGFYDEINPATLSGAIDVIVIQQEDGTFFCSPFHVKFGKLGVIRSREKIVDIQINEEYIEDLHMKLGESGEAFFVQPNLSLNSILNNNLDFQKSLISPNYIEEAVIDGCLSDYAGSVQSGDEDLATSPIWSGAEDDTHITNDSLHMETLAQLASINDQEDLPSLNGNLKNLSIGTSTCSKKHRTSCKRCYGKHDHRRQSSPIKDSTSPCDTSSILNTSTTLLNQACYTSLDSGLNELTSHHQNSLSPEYPAQLHKCINSNYSPKFAPIANLGDLYSNTNDAILARMGRKFSWPLTNRPISSFSETDVVYCQQTAALLNEKFRDQYTMSPNFCVDHRYKSDTELGEHRNSIPLSVKGHTFVPRNNNNNNTNSINLPGSSSSDPIKWKWGKLPQKKRKFSDDSPGVSSPITPADLSLNLLSNNSKNIHRDVFNFKPPDSYNTNKNDAKESVPTSVQTISPQNQLPPPQANSSEVEGGIYLDDLKNIDPQKMASYFPQSHYTPVNLQKIVPNDLQIGLPLNEPNEEFDNTESLNLTSQSLDDPNTLNELGDESLDPNMDSVSENQQPTLFNQDHFKSLTNDIAGPLFGSTSESLNFCELSVCGYTPRTQLPEPSQMDKAELNKRNLTNPFSVSVEVEAFERDKITYETLCNDSSIFLNPNLVARIGTVYYPWQIAVPLVITMFVYNKPIPENCLSDYVKLLPPAKRAVTSGGLLNKSSGSSSGSWFSWRRHHRPSVQSQINASSSCQTGIASAASAKSPKLSAPTSSSGSITKGDELGSHASSANNKLDRIDSVKSESNYHDPRRELINGKNQEEGVQIRRSTSFDATRCDVKEPVKQNDCNLKSPSSKWIKSLRLTSDQIAQLNLREGINDVTFSVTTQFQGTTRCASHIFLWKYDEKLVISDIDGTITKSDVLGHIFPFLGKDWSQYGVAELYSRICRNGYKFVYLSSRAIGQAPGTRGYLNSFKQNNMPLPQGPILLNPNSLFSAFHKEVIEKKPEEFKISCLKDIRALFPSHYHPFYAGFGNRITDVYAYRAVDIPISRIFTINYKGEISVDLTKTFMTSYSKLQDLADQVFPPVITTHRFYHNFEELPHLLSHDDMYPPLTLAAINKDNLDKKTNTDLNSFSDSLGDTIQPAQSRVPKKPTYSFVVKSHANDALFEADKFSNFTYWRPPLHTLSDLDASSAQPESDVLNTNVDKSVQDEPQPDSEPLKPNVINIMSNTSSVQDGKPGKGKAEVALAELNIPNGIVAKTGVLPPNTKKKNIKK